MHGNYKVNKIKEVIQTPAKIILTMWVAKNEGNHLGANDILSCCLSGLTYGHNRS